MQVKIGPKFFRNELKDYSDWVFAFAREIMQNSVDAGSKNIRCSVELVGGNTVLTILNDGSVMDRDVILGKLFALGESGKDMANSVGGFGKAKILLYMAQESYEVHSGNIKVVGCGGDFDVFDSDVYIDGVCSRVVVGGDFVDRFLKAFKLVACYSKWNGNFILNGEQFDANLNKGRFRRDVSCGRVFTNNCVSNIMLIRVGGLVTAVYRSQYKGCVVIELHNSSYLTSNRDGLQFNYRVEIDQFVSDISTNRRKAFEQPAVELEVFDGVKLFSKKSNKIEVSDSDIRAIDAVCSGSIGSGGVGKLVNAVNPTTGGVLGRSDYSRGLSSKSDCSLGFEFVLRNECGLNIPKHYHPYSFSKYSSSLAIIWAKLMVKLHDVFECSQLFNVGFVFSKSCEALRVQESGMVTYFINPAELVRHNATTSIKNRFMLTDRNKLLSIATHEFVHHECPGHDETFASRFTDAFNVVLDNRKEFNSCFKV